MQNGEDYANCGQYNRQKRKTGLQCGEEEGERQQQKEEHQHRGDNIPAKQEVNEAQPSERLRGEIASVYMDGVISLSVQCKQFDVDVQ